MEKGFRLLQRAQNKVAKTPLLPAEPLTSVSIEDLEDEQIVAVPWEESKDSIVMEIFDEDLSFEEGFQFELIGKCEIPIQDLIQKYTLLDTSQPEVYRWHPIELERHASTKQKNWFRPRLLIRAQIMLRLSVNNEGFDAENQEKKSMLHLFSRIKAFMRKCNNRLDGVVTLVERVANILNWTHPAKSRALFLVMVLLGVLMLLIPYVVGSK